VLNATLCTDLGYYYHANDVEEGARRVLEVIDGHDREAADYRSRQRALIGRYLPDDPQLVAAYSAALDALVREPLR
jgi:hypothetical protein